MRNYSILLVFLCTFSFAKEENHKEKDYSTAGELDAARIAKEKEEKGYSTHSDLHPEQERSETDYHVYEFPEVDSRCFHPANMNVKDKNVVTQFNKVCAIEIEIIRRTNADGHSFSRKLRAV